MAARKRILLAEISPRVPAHPVYATWNPADRNADVALSGANLVATKSTVHATNWACVRATSPILAGAYQWDTRYDYTGAADIETGIAMSSASLSQAPGSFQGVSRAVGVNKAGQIRIANTVVGNLGAIPSGTVLRHWFDADTGLYQVAVGAGPWVRVQPAQPGFFLKRPMYPIAGLQRPSGTTASTTGNFGASALSGAVQDGVNAGIYTVAAPTATTVYLASSKYNTNAGEVPSNTTYSARILPEPDVEIEREITCVAWGGSVISRRGQMVITNNDNKLDDWAWWIWRDAPYTLYSGYEGDPRSAFEVWSSGKVEQLNTTDAKRHVIVFADPLSELDRPALPENYPDDAANEQIRNQPKPFLLGRPLYCEGVRLSTADIGADAWKYDLDYLGLDGVDAVFDRGDLFKGPNDPYTPQNPITSSNGGAFTAWANDSTGVPMPQNFARVTGFGATNDRFQQGAAAGTLRMLSSGQMGAAIYHNASSVLAGYRYVINFTVTTFGKAGQVTFRADGPTPNLPFDDVVVPISTTGAVSATLDVKEQAQLQIVLGRTELDATIDNLSVSSVQVIDWTMPDNKGFKLANKPAGRIVANPRGAREAFDWIPLDDFNDWVKDDPARWEVVGSAAESASLYVTQLGSAARFVSPGGGTTWIGIRYLDPARKLRAGHTYFVSLRRASGSGGGLQVMVDGSATVYGTFTTGTSVITVTPSVTGALLIRTIPGGVCDFALDYAQVSDIRVAEGLPDFMRQLLLTRAGLAESAVDWASLPAVDDGMPDENDVIPGRLAYYSRQQQTYAQIVRAAMDSFNGWCVPNRLGQLTFGALRAPSRTPVLVLSKNNLATRPRIRPDLAPGLSTKLAGARNHSPHSDGDVADSVPAALRAALIEEFTRTVSAAPTLLEAGLKPVSDLLLQAIGAPAIRTLLQEESGMQVVVNIMATLYRDLNCFIDVDAVLPASTADKLEPGQTLQLVWDGYGLSNGANFVVKRVAGRFFGRIVPLTLWGKNASAD